MYNENFQVRAALNTGQEWHKWQMRLCLQVMMQPSPIQSDTSDSRHGQSNPNLLTVLQCSSTRAALAVSCIGREVTGGLPEVRGHTSPCPRIRPKSHLLLEFQTQKGEKDMARATP